MSEHSPELDSAAGEQVTRMLNELADDPDAPPTTVSASSVLAAVKATGDRPVEDSLNADEAAPGKAVAVRRSGVVVAPQAEATSQVAVPAGAQHRRHLDDDLAERRARRRRGGLIALVAAASVAAVAAVVIPIAVSRGSSTTTAADGAAVSATAADSLTADGGRALAAPSATTGADAAAGSAAEGAPGQADGLSERPAPGPDAITERVPVGDAPSESASGDAATPSVPAAASCWPELSEQAATALNAALPAGAFSPPGPLNLDCGTDPVAGALATGPTTRALAVRVTKTDPGSCARSAGEAAVLCVPQSDGSYVATDGGGRNTAFVYGNGYQVEVGPPPTPGTAAPSDTGLSADELVVVAQAVLGALG